jgi:hypothetical protein
MSHSYRSQPGTRVPRLHRTSELANGEHPALRADERLQQIELPQGKGDAFAVHHDLVLLHVDRRTFQTLKFREYGFESE